MNQSSDKENDCKINDLGTQITGLDHVYKSYNNHENKYEKKSVQYKRDLYDLI